MGLDLLGLFQNYLAPFLLAREQEKGTEEANAANEARFQQALGVFGTPGAGGAGAGAGGSGIGGAINQIQQQRGGGLAQMGRDVFGQLGQQIPAGFQQLGQQGQQGINQLIAQMQGLGGQERTDINRAYDDLAGVQDMDLIARGLRSSTIAPTMRRGLEEERGGALGRLEERLRREQIGLGAAGLDITQQAGRDVLGAQERLGLDGLNFQTGLGQNLVNLLGAKTDLPPDPNSFLQSMQGLGMASKNQPEEPSTMSQIAGPLIGAGGSIAGGALAGGALSGGLGGGLMGLKAFIFCIDGGAMLETPGGYRTLAEIPIGAEVKGTDGLFHPVKAKDFGHPHAERKDDYIKITMSHGSLVLTKDHILYGRKAGTFRLGMLIDEKPVISVEPHEAIPSGDVTLEGCKGYYANGFPVMSMEIPAAAPLER